MTMSGPDKLVLAPIPVRPCFVNLSGLTFGRLSILGYKGQHGHSQAWWCRCTCGRVKAIDGQHLRRGHTKSCGCLNAESRGKSQRTHGSPGTPEFRAWKGTIARCTNPNAAGYKNWGGRGIRVCPRWRHSFAAFLADMGPRPTPKHSLDRIDNNGHYEPGNVRWATFHQQANNRRNTVRLTFNGITRTLTEWAAVMGIRYQTLHRRLSDGWSVERALLAPVMYWHGNSQGGE